MICWTFNSFCFATKVAMHVEAKPGLESFRKVSNFLKCFSNSSLCAKEKIVDNFQGHSCDPLESTALTAVCSSDSI